MPLVVTIEHVPDGDAERAEIIAGLEIENRADHPGGPELANYEFRIFRHVSDDKTRMERGEVLDFPRVELNAWDLVFRCLLACGLENRRSTMDAALRQSETRWFERASEHAANGQEWLADSARDVAHNLGFYRTELARAGDDPRPGS